MSIGFAAGVLTVAHTAEESESGEMIREGRELAKIHKNIVVKLPLTPPAG